jgi:hypothetical protein
MLRAQGSGLRVRWCAGLIPLPGGARGGFRMDRRNEKLFRAQSLAE